MKHQTDDRDGAESDPLRRRKDSTEAALEMRYKALSMIGEYCRTCLTIHCARHIGVNEVIEQLANAMIVHGIPKHTRCIRRINQSSNLSGVP